MTSLADLPPRVLSCILDFVPQHLLLNLALTNFHFYEPCSQQLYRRIHVQTAPVLRNDTLPHPRQRLDFLDLCTTTICGFKDASLEKGAHLRLVAAKVNTLAQSLAVNPQLANFVTEIHVVDLFDAEVRDALARLLTVLSTTKNSVKKVYFSDSVLRGALAGVWSNFSLTSVVIDANFPIEKAKAFALNELVVADFPSDGAADVSVIPLLEGLTSLRIRDDPKVFARFSAYLLRLCRERPFVMKLKTFSMVISHNYVPLPIMELSLENLQISLGCVELLCQMQCLTTALGELKLQKLKRLSITESETALSHKVSEQWDLIIFDFIRSVVNSCPSLFYLSIRHNVPPDGIIDDGYEGNYLRKVRLYTMVLPSILGNIKNHIVNLALPQFVSVLACYEQAMNTFLWNGCECRHCSPILELLDEYLLYHRYYSPEKHVFKDMQTVQMMRAMGEALSGRIPHDRNTGDLFLGPMRNVSWDFHSNALLLPFQCLPVKTYDIAEMEDDAEEPFFDAEDKANDCRFLRDTFCPRYPIVVLHFLDDLIRRMINLNRGDAEEADINQASCENDGFTTLRINKMVISGIDYNFDHEPNGTIFFTNSYDGR